MVPIRTQWPVNSDVYIFKSFNLEEPADMVARTAIDNGYDFNINDFLVDSKNKEGFTYYWQYTFIYPASLFHAGLNWLASPLEDHGGTTAWGFCTFKGWT